MKKYMEKHPNALNFFAMVTVILLGLQFIFGIYVNLFVQFPENVLGWIVIHGNFVASCHLYLGSLLTLLAIFVFIMAVAKKQTAWIAVSVLGFAGILSAALNGVAFAGSQNDVNSFFMAFGFIFAMLVYAFGLYREAKQSKL